METSRQVDLNVLAERTGISLDVLKQGNPELKYHITPPTSAHMLKVPSNMAETAKTVLKDISTPLFKYDMYKVKSGDTLGAVAERYDTSLNIILQANPGIKADKIKIGQTIIIPPPFSERGAIQKKQQRRKPFLQRFLYSKEGRYPLGYLPSF